MRTNDSRADFFAVYRREAAEFDRDYVQKYDEDLNTTLIFVSVQFGRVQSTLTLAANRPVCSPQSVRLS